jgi:Glycosyl hydrolase family 63 C-terminal domain
MSMRPRKTTSSKQSQTERERLLEDEHRTSNWKRWGPYLPERQWGTVREDYSDDGSVWSYFTHDQARSRTYRWGEDGLLGLTDRQCRLCFSVALWNTKDSILKERLFGLSGAEGNHGEDVKECYYYLDSTPTHSYMRALYKYPQNEFPYAHLVDENRRRGRLEREYEITDTGIFDSNEYFDVFVEYAKAGANDILVKITAHNRHKKSAPLYVIPQAWFRNTWAWGRSGEGYTVKPRISSLGSHKLLLVHPQLDPFVLMLDPKLKVTSTTSVFTDNETNAQRLFGRDNTTPYVKDAFHRYVVNGEKDAVNPEMTGTKSAFICQTTVPAHGSVEIRLRLVSSFAPQKEKFGDDFDDIIERRKQECHDFYDSVIPASASPDQRSVMTQSYAGLLWTKQFYYYSIKEWLEGDPTQPVPSESRKRQKNSEWEHLYNRDIISVPDKWEYPWYAAWDLAFHMLTFARIDSAFAKQQLILMLREWYMHPNGQIPAYEFEFSNVNPPVHAWACWRVYQMGVAEGRGDRNFLKRVFAKLLINFTWWVNRKDAHGKNLFSGGFLGLDNIGVFDRSAPLPKGGTLQQADATAWMAFYCGTMLTMALELAAHDEEYEDLASKFFEHFISIASAINHFGGTGLWDQLDGFYYDALSLDEKQIPLRVRSLVGVIPLLAVEVLDNATIDKLPGFKKRFEWFVANQSALAKHIAYTSPGRKEKVGEINEGSSGLKLLAIPSAERLTRMLRYILDEKEFLSPYGMRSLSKIHAEFPYRLTLENRDYSIDYCPGDSNTDFFGGNSNWRGPIWFPINFLLIEALDRYHTFYGDSFTIECPTGSGNFMNLRQVADEISNRLSNLFLRDKTGRRPCHGEDARYANSPFWKDLVLFYEHFHGDDGRGIGASHQTGWTSLVSLCIERSVGRRARVPSKR